MPPSLLETFRILSSFDPPRGSLLEMDSYRYAKLQDNAQVFVIKYTKLRQDVFVAFSELRDPNVVRFKTQDARHVELTDAQHTDLAKLKADVQKALDQRHLAELEYKQGLEAQQAGRMVEARATQEKTPTSETSREGLKLSRPPIDDTSAAVAQTTRVPTVAGPPPA